jgi:hypothetical protein
MSTEEVAPAALPAAEGLPVSIPDTPDDGVVVSTDDMVDREPTREERLRMAAQMKMTCDSLAQLLKYYVQQEQDLKQLCAEFIVRDIEEENQRIALTRRCLEEQRTTMRSAAFVKWAHENNKGSLAHGPVTAEQLATMGDDSADKKSAAAYEFHEESVDTFCVDVGGVGCLYAPRTMFGCPGPLVQVMLAWRKAPSASATNAIEAIDLARNVNAEPSVLVINGHVVYAGLDATDDDVRRDFGRACPGIRDMTPENKLRAWHGWLLSHAAGTATKKLLASVHEAENLTTSLRDDGTDAMAIVPLTAVSDALFVRIVLLGSTGVAVETPLPAVDHEAITGLRVQDVVAALTESLKQLPTPTQPRQLRMITVAAKQASDSMQLTVVGSEALTPSSSLDRWSWSDLCGVARVAKEVTSEGGRVTPVVRSTNHRVVDLAAAGILSKEWAEILTGDAAVPVTEPKTTSSKAHAEVTSSQLMAVTMAATLCVAVGWLLGRRK